MKEYISVIKNYVGFEGRAGRREFWMFVLFNLIIAMVLGVIDFLLFNAGETGISPLSSVYSLAILLPALAVSVRRLHDTGKTGWLILLGLIPLVGAIILIVFYASAGTQGPNQYGEAPA